MKRTTGKDAGDQIDATPVVTARAPRRTRRLLSSIFLVCALFGMAAVAYLRFESGNLVSAGTRTPPRSGDLVSVVLSKREDLSNQLRISGEFLPYQEINVYARVAGYVRQMKVDVGDHVKAGDVLAILEIPELDSDLQRSAAAKQRSAQEVIRAKAAYDEAHLSFERLSEVIKQQPNLIAQQEIDQARARDDTMHASWTAAQSAEGEARADQAKLTTMVGYSRITAPFAGVVSKRYADTGSLVGAGTGTGSQALVRLSQLNPLRLVLPVPESAVPNIHVGAPVEIALQSTKQTFSANVSRTSGRVSTETRTLHVEVDVANPGLRLAPGMYATATLELETRKQVIGIPVEALQDRQDAAATVLVLDSRHKIEQRKIAIGMETASRIEVVSGLSEGEMVVLGGGGRYQPGQSAEPKLVAGSGPR
ncbi:MAG: efflux RND transporter periplasmic adaptor subunit [Betaproteobacteria bacterium]